MFARFGPGVSAARATQAGLQDRGSRSSATLGQPALQQQGALQVIGTNCASATSTDLRSYDPELHDYMPVTKVLHIFDCVLEQRFRNS